MQITHEAITSASFLYEQLKFWIPVVGFGWGIYKSFAWVKAIREKDLTEINTGVNSMNVAVEKMETSLTEQIKSQTVSIVDQLKELRSDFRTFYTIPQPQMVPARLKATKPRAKTVAKKTTKKVTKPASKRKQKTK